MRTSASPSGPRWERAPLIRRALLILVGLSVTIVLGSFAAAPLRQGDGAYSIGAQGIAAGELVLCRME